MEYTQGKDYYLLYSLVGNYDKEFIDLMQKNNRHVDYEKFVNFYISGRNREKTEKGLGLDINEIMCCISKKDPAVIYHIPYGLILSGEIKTIFDNDSGLRRLENGTYPTEPYYNFTNKVSLENIMTTWYDHFEKSSTLNWNEAILKKGAKIIGAFHDPSFNSKILRNNKALFKDSEYQRFIEKIIELKLDLIEIKAKYIIR